MSIVNSSRWFAGVGSSCSLLHASLLFFRQRPVPVNKAIVKTNSFERSADMLVLSESDQAAHTGLEPCVAKVIAKIFVCLLIVGTWHEAGLAADPNTPDQALETRIQGLIPDIERYITSGMKSFDVPGLAIGIIANDKLVYGKGFGVRAKEGGGTVDTKTVFQIGSATKAFLGTTLAIMVDRSRFKWDDRVVDLYPDFQLKDPWVTREFRVFDLIAQRSSLPPYANEVTEIDALNGYIVRRGADVGVPVPVNNALFTLVKLAERSSAMFDVSDQRSRRRPA